MKIPRRYQAVIGVAALSVLLVSGCSRGSASTAVTSPLPSSPAPAATGPSASDALGPSGGASGAPSTGGVVGAPSSGTGMSMRVVNLFAPNNVAGPALDIYDVQLTGQAATPVVANLAYGAVSAFFTPQSGPAAVDLYAIPAGEDPVARAADAQGFAGVQDDGSHAQVTWVLTAGTGGAGTGPLTLLQAGSRVEKGTNNGSTAPVAPPPPAGQGEILADDSAVSGLGFDSYLMIDASCAPPLNGDKAMGQLPMVAAVDGEAPVSNFAVFATSPGTVQVSVVSRAEGLAPTCAQLTAKQGSTSIQIAAGQQVEAYIYGTSATDLHLAIAPIQQ